MVKVSKDIGRRVLRLYKWAIEQLDACGIYKFLGRRNISRQWRHYLKIMQPLAAAM